MADTKDAIFADEEAVLFKIKGVRIDSVDQATRSIAVRFGKPDAPIRMTGLPLGADISIRASFVFPGVGNNPPFEWDRLESLVGKQVSMHLKTEASGMTVESIATAND